MCMFLANPKLSYKREVTRLGRYLIDTIDRGVLCKPDKTKGLEYFVNIDFTDSWIQDNLLNPKNVLFYSGFVILYTGIPIFWRSKLQMEIALFTCKAEYITLSSAIREVIPLI